MITIDGGTGVVTGGTLKSSGSVIQTKQTYRTSLFSETLTQGNFSSAVMTCTITPASSTSKIIVI